MSIVYETTGRAKEYFELAANLYSGCTHACTYCYIPMVLHKEPKEVFVDVKPRESVLFKLGQDAARLSNSETRHILLSFVTDPYQPLEESALITRRAIQILHDEGLVVAILTKGGLLATRDFDLLTKHDLFGVSLTCHEESTWQKWEPNTAPPLERIDTLETAKKRGIMTWASCEPVLDPVETLDLIRETAGFVDVFKVGKLNYREEAKKINWKLFAQDAVRLLDNLGANYYIKKDLAKYIGHKEGIRKGNLPK